MRVDLIFRLLPRHNAIDPRLNEHEATAPGDKPEQSIEHISSALARLVETFGAIILLRRQAQHDRFRGPSKWRRILCLGILLIDFAIIGIAASFYELALIAYEPGTTAVIGGATLAIIIFRISRPALPLDWIFVGVCLAGAGLTLARDPAMSSLTTHLVFSLLLTATSIALLWIGATASPAGGRAWISAGGFTTLICAVVNVVNYSRTPVLRPDIVASVIMLLIGMSLLGFALSLRNEN